MYFVTFPLDPHLATVLHTHTYDLWPLRTWDLVENCQTLQSGLHPLLKFPSLQTIDISYTLDSASVYQKWSQKSQRYPIITIGGGHIGRSHSSKKCHRKHYTFLHLYIKYFLGALIKEDLLSTLSISAIQSTQLSCYVSTLWERPAPAIWLQFSPAHGVGCTI